MTVTATATIDKVRLLVEPEIKNLLNRLDPHTRLVAGYHLGYWDRYGSPTEASGKGLRPALALLSARACGAEVERGVPAAAAVELVHNFSLLHDDVMDGDIERRHRPTAWHIFGAGPAILAGDALLSLANEALSATSEPTAAWAINCLNMEVRRLVAGQAADLAFEQQTEVDLSACLDMARDKTAALLSCACAIGSMLCDAPPPLIMGLTAYGRHLGMAFQLVDDLLGIWGAPEVTGKPVLSDLRARKKSLPVVWASHSQAPAGVAFRELYRLPRELNTGELELAALLLEEAGARTWAQEQAREEVAAARTEVAGLHLPADVAAELDALAGFVIERDH